MSPRSRLCSLRLAVPIVIGVLTAPLEPAWSAPPGRIRMLPQVTVVGAVVRLSDLGTAEGTAAEFAELEVAHAPAPGESRRLSGQALLERLRDAGVDDSIAYTIPATVSVARAFQLVGQAELRPEVEAQLEERLAAGDRLEALELPRPLRIALGSYEVEVGEISARRTGAGYRNVDLRILQDDGVVATATARVKIATFGPVVVTRQPVARGALLRPDDLRIEERRLDELPGTIVGDLDEVVGKEARVSLAAGRVLTMHAVANASLIRRGELVRVVVDHGGLRLSASAEALETAGEGDSIRVVNPTSGRELTGRVIDHGTVLVSY